MCSLLTGLSLAGMSRSFRTPEQALKKAQEKTKSGERVQAVQALHNLLTSVSEATNVLRLVSGELTLFFFFS